MSKGAGRSLVDEKIGPQTVRVVGSWMEIEHQIPKRPRRRLIIHLQGWAPKVSKALTHQHLNARLIARVLEGDDVMSIARNGLGILAWRKQVLTQAQDGDVAMMRVFFKEIQDSLIVTSFLHQIVQH